MESELAKLGSSILVPSVQELAKEALGSLPLRYQRPDQDPPFTSIETCSPPQLRIPVIDMLRLFSGDSMDDELEKLHLACKDGGYFQLINHGVCSALVDEVKKGIQELFKPPMEEKKKLWQRPGDLEGFGQAFAVSGSGSGAAAGSCSGVSKPSRLGCL